MENNRHPLREPRGSPPRALASRADSLAPLLTPPQLAFDTDQNLPREKSTVDENFVSKEQR